MRFTLAAFLLAHAAVSAAAPRESRLPRPPALPAQPVTETYFGTQVTDRFRFVEQLAPATLDWMRAQGAYTRSVLDTIAPRAALVQRMNGFGGQFGFALDPQYGGERLFYLDRAPGVDQYSLVVREPDGTRRVLIDVPALAKASGQPQAIDHFEPSRDGRFVAVGIAAGGSESAMLTVIDVASGRTVAGPERQGPFTTTSWDVDGKSLFFNRMPDPEGLAPGDRYKNSEVLHWTLGEAPRVVVGAKQKLGPNDDPVRFPVLVTPRGTDRTILMVVNGVANEIEAWEAPRADAAAGRARWRKIVSTSDAVTDMYATPDRIVLLTHRDAPNFKVMTMPWTGTAATATTVIAQKPDTFLEQVKAGRDAIYVRGRERLTGAVWRVAADGTVARLPLPATGNVAALEAESDRDGVLIQMDSLSMPATTFGWRPGASGWAPLGLETRPAVDFGRYVTRELDATAQDGTKVPLVVLVPPGPRGPRPFLLDAYGSYGATTLPFFSARRLVSADAGLGYASCSVRGGGELGEKWRLGGKDENKPNTWRDAIACAETLIAQGYTTAAMLTIQGTSAGGIMVGRAATERPDLFAAAVSRVGDSNALRSETMPSGAANVPEFGTVADPKGFRNLLEMDATQHVREGTRYPPFLLTTGLNDPRVAPWQAGKIAARLQEVGDLALIRIDPKAGHGMGTTRSARDEEEADITAFALWRAGVPAWQPAR